MDVTSGWDGRSRHLVLVAVLLVATPAACQKHPQVRPESALATYGHAVLNEVDVAFAARSPSS
jgi:hypothetical protein